jgi:hypothetical protein
LHVDTCTFTLWKFPVTLEFGGQLILAQTTSGASNGCQTDGTMDTSDIGPGGENYAGNCNPDGIKPEVDVTENVGGSDVTTPYSDTGQVINTGGFDLGECPPGTSNSEASQWTSIGSPSCGSAALALAPLAQTHFDGQSATVIATLTCSNTHAALPGAPVNLAILSGPNPVLPPFSPGTTDASGNVSFTYTDPVGRLGTDTLQASVMNLTGTFNSNSVTATWVDQPLDCSKAAPSVAQLWPPNHKFVPVTIIGVTDPDSLPITTTITSIRQDQPTLEPGSGNFCPDADPSSIGTSTAQLRAERDGQDPDGRVYYIAFSAKDTEGATCTGQVTVCVPHDQSNPVGCVGDGPLYDSTVCAP